MESKGRKTVLMPIEVAEDEEVVFYVVTILSGDKSEVRVGQHVSKEQKSLPLWRANILRSLADTIELEAKLDEGE